MKESQKKFKEYLSANHLKMTPQRTLIFKVFLSSDEPISPDTLLERVQEIDDSVSRSTVYRTIKHLLNAGIARCIHQSDGSTLYEPMSDHYSQFICERCERSFPIINPFMDCLQEETARQQGFSLFRYQTTLYGLCNDCRAVIRPKTANQPAQEMSKKEQQ